MVTASARQPVSKPNAASTVTARDLAERAMERRAVEAAIWACRW